MGRNRLGRLMRAGLISLLACLWLSSSSQITFAQLEDTILDISWPVLAQSTSDAENAVVASCVYLDGYCAFRVAAPRSDLNNRIRTIEIALAQIRKVYTAAPNPELTIELRQDAVETSQPPPAAATATESPAETPRKPPSIYLTVGGQTPVRLMSVTGFDTSLKGLDVETTAASYFEQVEEGEVDPDTKKEYGEDQEQQELKKSSSYIKTSFSYIGSYFKKDGE